MCIVPDAFDAFGHVFAYNLAFARVHVFIPLVFDSTDLEFTDIHIYGLTGKTMKT